MRLKWLMFVGALVVIAVVVPVVLWIIGAVALTVFIGAIYIVRSGMTSEGQRQLVRREVQRRVEGLLRRQAAVRREAAHLDAVDRVREGGHGPR